MTIVIRHIGLVVANLPAAIDFWCLGMGFKVVRTMEEFGPHLDAMMGLTGVEVTTVKLTDSNNGMLELLYFKSHPDKPHWIGTPFSTGLTHIAFTVESLAKTCQRLKGYGVIYPAEPQISPDGSAKVIYAKGPEGILLELVEVISK
jgi:catechol 2,3-dioxygenase-like lactoylglutathione lyase family enzyme